MQQQATQTAAVTDPATVTNPPTGQGGRIVVGVDGSPGSSAALRWAIGQAQMTGARIEAIASWQDPVESGYSFGWVATTTDGGFDWAAISEASLDGAVATAVGEAGAPVEIAARVVHGHPAQVLLEAAVGAESLVVGSRGHGTLAGMLLGSVSQHCVQHAPCPVVVVPTDAPELDERAQG